MNVLPVIGVLVVLVVLQDVFTTVLFPSSERGLLRKPTSAGVWRVFQAAASRLSDHRRRRLLSYGGPVVITANLAAWVVLMIVGFALIYQPALGEGIEAASGATDTSWATAIYYSGFTATTLGVGDVAAAHGLYRVLAVVQAALGFAGISMAITYFLSVYGNLTERNAGAQALHHRTGGTGDAAALIVGVADGGSLSDGRQGIATTAGYLRHVCQSHAFYPVLRYFHYTDPAFALPRVLLVALDSSTLLRTTVAGDESEVLLASRSLEELELASIDLLEHLVRHPGDRLPDDHEEVWRRRHEHAIAALRLSGFEVAADPDRYVALRRVWEPRLRSLTRNMRYEWDDIDVACCGDAA